MSDDFQESTHHEVEKEEKNDQPHADAVEQEQSGSTEESKPSVDAKSSSNTPTPSHANGDDLPKFDTENGLCYPHAVGHENILGSVDIKKDDLEL